MEQFIQENVPLRHLLNEETLLMSWQRSAIKEVNYSVLNPHCSKFVPKSATNISMFNRKILQQIQLFVELYKKTKVMGLKNVKLRKPRIYIIENRILGTKSIVDL